MLCPQGHVAIDYVAPTEEKFKWLDTRVGPLIQKLGVKPDARIHFINAPPHFATILGQLPPGVEHVGGTVKNLDVAVMFATEKAKLIQRFPSVAARIASTGMLWVAWPKKASGVLTDVNENIVREIGLQAGLVDTKVCAIDNVWSGLKFVIRLKDRR